MEIESIRVIPAKTIRGGRQGIGSSQRKHFLNKSARALAVAQMTLSGRGSEFMEAGGEGEKNVALRL